MKYKKLNPFEEMLCNILAEGQDNVWQELEKINNPLQRCSKRKLFGEAVKKIYDNKL